MSYICKVVLGFACYADYIVNFLSVFIAVLAAFFIAKWQLGQQKRLEDEKNNILLQTYLRRVTFELNFNKSNLIILREIISKQSRSRVDHWDWMFTIADSFQKTAYEDLLRTGLQKLLPSRVEKSMFITYRMIDTLFAFIKQGRAITSYSYGCTGSGDIADGHFDGVKNYANTVLKRVKYTYTTMADYNLLP
jgi:predicted DNA-binding transcriptional regulator